MASRSDPSHFLWPLRVLPVIPPGHAARFPMLVPGCNRAYRHPTVALHLYDYRGMVQIARRRFRLQPGDLTLSPANTGSRYDLPESGTHLCIHFERPAAVPTAPTIFLPLHFRLGARTAAARERFWRIIDAMRSSGGRPDAPATAAASASLQEFLLWLHGQSRRGPAPRRDSIADRALEKLSRAVEASLTKPMLIEELAAGIGLSADYAARLFARRHGMTLQHYLLLRRIELARHLLISSDLRVAEIGQRIGLPDPQYFNKQFRRIAGLSPLAYRQQQRAPAAAGKRSGLRR